MKIREDDYKRLEKLVKDVFILHPTAKVIYAEKGLSETRLVWDIYHHTTDTAQREGRVEDYLFLRSLYDYLNDNHLTTALKAIIRPL